MCGIVGYSGFQNAKNIVIDGLKTLEYRGYDSAGIALVGEKLKLYKCPGRVSALEEALPDIRSHTAIGHTRWATHGVPSAKNAHPHMSFDESVAVVHNGVIENCEELRACLVRQGVEFASDTDSEIIAHLLALEDTSDMISAINNVGKMLVGATTFLAVKSGDDRIYCRRKGASLAIGIGDGENFVASDTLALSKYTKKTVILKDDECAVVSPDGVKFFKDGAPIQKQPVKIKRAAVRECNCHMRAEIDEIPAALKRTAASFEECADEQLVHQLKSAKKIVLCGCGTAYHACLYGEDMLEKALDIPCQSVVASEFDRVRFLDKSCFAIFITQSGETADTLCALETCRAAGVKTLAITNVPASSVTFAADKTILLDAGAEIAVAATKSYCCQLLCLYLLAKRIENEDRKDSVDKLYRAIDLQKNADMYEDRIKKSNLFFVGKGLDNVTAQEGALKFKEITYKMTDAYAAGELKHGTIALIDERSTVIFIVTSPKDKHRIEATVSELRSRGAHTIALSSVGDVGANKTLTLPFLDDADLYPVLSVIPLQNLALTASLCLELNPDKPRNLAKSVTVI